jgi:hypothetical protein
MPMSGNGAWSVYLHGEVLELEDSDLAAKDMELVPTPTLQERLKQLARQQRTAPVQCNTEMPNEVPERLRPRDQLKAIVIEAVVDVYSFDENYRLLDRLTRFAKDLPAFGSDFACAILHPGQ